MALFLGLASVAHAQTTRQVLPRRVQRRHGTIDRLVSGN